MVVSLVDRRTFPRLARPPAITPKIIPPAFAAAGRSATAATRAFPARLKIAPTFAAAALVTTATATAFTGPATLTAAATRTVTPLATPLKFPRWVGLGGCRRNGSRSRFGRGDFFA